MDLMGLKASLQLCELFLTLDSEELDLLIQHGTVEELPCGKILYMKGAKSDNTFCFLDSGAVNIVAKDGHVVKEISEGKVFYGFLKRHNRSPSNRTAGSLKYFAKKNEGNVYGKAAGRAIELLEKDPKTEIDIEGLFQ